MRLFRTLLIAAGLSALLAAPAVSKDGKPAELFSVVVMDPLAAPLSCPCVKGYAQRDYDKLARHLEKELGRPVKVFFAETLGEALRKKSQGKADLIIGKDSVVRAGAKDNGLSVTPIASLSGKDGKTTQTGLIVVANLDPALTASDLKGYRVIFGPADCDEKNGAALKLLKASEIAVPGKIETCNACSDGALKVIDGHKAGEKIATVISSYAQPLLEGCGTIKKGDLRVVGETDPVAFITAFTNDKLPNGDRAIVEKALLGVGKVRELCTALETKNGFVAGAKKK
jgi:ABC-type phosphate/phosphonate transport system substrate-binding protein